MGGGGEFEGRLEFFRKFVRFGSAILPLQMSVSMQMMEEKGSSSCGVLCYIGSSREIERVPPGSRGALGCWFTMEPGPSTTVYNGMT